MSRRDRRRKETKRIRERWNARKEGRTHICTVERPCDLCERRRERERRKLREAGWKEHRLGEAWKAYGGQQEGTDLWYPPGETVEDGTRLYRREEALERLRREEDAR